MESRCAPAAPDRMLRLASAPRGRRHGRDHPSRKAALPRRRNHQGRRLRLLRVGGGGDAAAHRGAAGDDGAFPGRHRQEGLHSEGRVEGISRLAAAGGDPQARRRRGRGDRALSAGRGCARAGLAGQPELDHAARLDLARAGAAPPRRLRVRSRPFRRRAGQAAHGGPGGARPPGRAWPAELRQDFGVEGVSHRGRARRPGRLRAGATLLSRAWAPCW